MQLISDLIALAAQARRNGLLSLVKEAEETSLFLLRKGLNLILEGMEPESVRSVLEHYLVLGDYRGKELLERCIILEGVVAIQSGINPWMIKEKLLALIGEDGHEIYDREFEDKKTDKLEAFLKRIENAPPSSPMASRVDKIIIQLNDEAIQQFLKGINTVELAKAVQGMGGKAKVKIFSNLSRKAATLLKDDLDNMEALDESETTEAQKKVVEIISDLKEQGFI